jgi:hypothetical protein
MGDTINIDSLANASGADLAKFLAQNNQVLAEVTQHAIDVNMLGGTSQAHALGFQEYLPADFSLESLSTHLSKKGYTMVQESLAAVLLVAGAAAIVAGVGILAYKLIRMSMGKEPKASEALKHAEAAKKLAAIMTNLDMSRLPPEFQKLFTEYVQAETVAELRKGWPDSDTNTRALDAFIRTRLQQSSASVYAVRILTQSDAQFLMNSAGKLIDAMADGLAQLDSRFLRVVIDNPKMSGLEASKLAESISASMGTSNFDNAQNSIIGWAAHYGVQTGNSELQDALLAFEQAMFTPASADLINTVDLTKSMTFSPPAKPVVEKLYAKIKDLKKLGDHLKRSGDNFKQISKDASNDLTTQVKAVIDQAMAAVELSELVTRLVDKEVGAIHQTIGAVVNGGKDMHAGIIAVIGKMEDKEEAARVKRELSALLASGKVPTMRTEALEDNRLSLNQVMVLEGRSGILDFLKQLGIVLMIGMAVGVLYSAIMAMFGVASFSAAWAGGINYILANGKRVTTKEASDALAATLKNNSVGQYGVNSITRGSNNNLPFVVDTRMIDSGFTVVSDGIKKAIAAFSAGDFTGNPEHVNAAVIRASNNGNHVLDNAINTLKGKLIDLGLPISRSSGSDDPIAELRAKEHEFSNRWFNGSNCDYSKFNNNFTTSWIERFDPKAPEKIENYAEHIVTDMKRFASTTSGVNKETFKELSDEALDAHHDFTLKMAYLAALSGVYTKITKAAVKDVLGAIGALKSTFRHGSSYKMVGESRDTDFDEDDGMDALDYDDTHIDGIMDQSEVMADLNVDEQATLVMESWGKHVQTGLMVLGALALVGVGALILKSITSGKSKPHAEKEHFKATAAGIATGNALDQLADKLVESTNNLKAAVQDESSIVATQAQAKGTQEFIGRDDGASNTADKPNPEGRAGNDHADIISDIDELGALVEKWANLNYVGRLKLIGQSTVVSYGAVGALTAGMNPEFKDFQQKGLEEVVKFFTFCEDKIFGPVNEALASHFPQDRLADIHDDVVAAIADAIGLGAVPSGLTDAMAEEIATVTKPADEADWAELERDINPNGYGSGADDYMKLVNGIQKGIAETTEFVNKAEGSHGDLVTRAAAEVKGSRTKGSSLLLRIDEFRPTFTEATRFFRTSIRMMEALCTCVEESIRLHRRAQRQDAAGIQEQGEKLGRIKGKLRANSNDKSKSGDILDKLEEMQKELEASLKKSGL